MVDKKYKRVLVDDITYEIVPPDGGWGYLIALSTTIIYIATVVPMAGFGLIFREFLSSLGDDTGGVTLTNGLFNTVSFFMGLIANVLLNKISYRKVALVGSLCHFIGAFGTVFVVNLTHLIIFVGIFEGMGFGLLLPSALSAFNEYFDKKLHLWISISQTGMVIGYMLMPQLAAWSMSCFGFRGSILVLLGLSILTLPAAMTLQPVKKHMRMVRIDNVHDIEMLQISTEEKQDNSEPLNSNPLLEKKSDKESTNVPKAEKLSCWKTLTTSMDLVKDPKYLNVCIGLALCFTADIAFYPIIPLILAHVNYTRSDIALIMSVYFGADLAARIALSLVSAFVKYKSRILFFWGALLSIVFRTVWLLNNTFWWNIGIMVILGILRCFIETLVSLVISEEYPNRFASAFSLYMVANGVACLICGPLMTSKQIREYPTFSSYLNPIGQ